jgi:hypothetical protein
MKSTFRGLPALTGLLFLAAGLLLNLSLQGTGTGQLIIEAPRSGVVYYSLPALPGDEFTLSYRHSVSRSMVYGCFLLTAEGGIQPLSSTFSAFGPGLPWVDGQEEFSVDGGKITVLHHEAPRDKISLWVSPLTGEKMNLHSNEYGLAVLAEGPLLLEIRFEAP